jgi:hypothetical protein
MEKTDKALSRRKLLVAGGAAAVAGSVLIASSKSAISRRSRSLIRAQPFLRRLLSLADAGYDEWAAQVGSLFAVGGGNPIQLVGVRALNSGGERPPGLGRDRAFVAMFNVLGGGTMAGDLIYTASHPEYGPLQIFLGASSDPATPGRMLAVYN